MPRLIMRRTNIMCGTNSKAFVPSSPTLVGRNPVRVATTTTLAPRVVAARQPWAVLCNRVAVEKALPKETRRINSLHVPETGETLVNQIEPGTGSISQSPLARLLKIFAPAPALPIQSTDPAEVARQYRHWQKRVLLTSIIGYATFYFVRKNLSVAMPYLEHGLGIRKTQLGLFLTLHGLLYGVSKFANGFLGDRANARAFMAFGLGASALMNVLFGFNSAVVVLGLIWVADGWFQGMGFPPCARLLAHWFPPKQLASRMSIWNISHSIGGGLIVILCGYLVVISWRLAFFVPAAIAFACVIFIWFTLPDTPPSVGLPEVEGTERHSEKHESGAA